MIVEFTLILSLALPNIGPQITPVEFIEPVQQVITYPSEGVLNQVSGLELPRGIREEFEENFQTENNFFGAFAISKNFDYGYVTGTNSLEAARDIALAECRTQAPRCMIYAEILPQGYVPLGRGQVSLAPEAAAYFNTPDPDWGNYRAMAVSEDGAYSVVWGHDTPREASEAAMSDCLDYVIDNLEDLRDMPCVLIPFK